MENEEAPSGRLRPNGWDVFREMGLDDVIALLRQPAQPEGLLETWLDALEGQP